MLNTDSYNRLIAHVAETDTITAVAIHALLNKVLAQSPAADYAEWGEQPELLTLISEEEWQAAHESLDKLRYAQIEVAATGLDDEKMSAEVKRVQAYMPRGWIASIRSVGNYDEGTVRQVISICGHDNAGWTLDDYVIPRLASGNIFAKEVAA